MSIYDSTLNTANYIYSYLKNEDGWQHRPLCALLGNMYRESGLIWNRQETGGSGYGLVQWTPKEKYTSWVVQMGYTDSLETQLKRIIWERENGVQYYVPRGGQYNLSFTEFSRDTTHSIRWLTMAFMANYERARADQFYGQPMEVRYLASEWYNEHVQEGAYTVDPGSGINTQNPTAKYKRGFMCFYL